GLVLAAARRGPAGFHGYAVGDPVQPVGDRALLADGAGLFGEDEEGGLERVLRVLLVPQEVPADAQDERAVARQQGGERGLILLGAEGLQGLGGVQLPRRLGVEELVKVVEKRPHRFAGPVVVWCCIQGPVFVTAGGSPGVRAPTAGEPPAVTKTGPWIPHS